MTILFDYIVCFYFGERRNKITSSLLSSDRYGFVKKHIAFLQSLMKKKNGLNNIIFVINNIDDSDYTTVKALLEKSKLKNYDVINRPNLDYSYGAWNDALIKNLNSEAKYAYLTEDDYIPAQLDFYKPFFKQFDGNTAYVCQFYVNSHAAISNGFIDYEKCRIVYKEKQTIFRLLSDRNQPGEYNQIFFLRTLTNEFKYSAKDITKEAYSIFLDGSSRLIPYGNLNGTLTGYPILELPLE